MPRGKPVSTIEDRFLRKCVPEQRVEGMTECWIWVGCKSSHKDKDGNSNPYAEVTRQTYGTSMGHQWSCHNWNGSPLPIEKGMCIKHACDIKLCVNPEHLSYGTLQENIKEMEERNPTAMGRIPPTDAELTLLREMVQNDVPRREMARRIGHSRHWVDRIKREYFSES